VIRKLLVLLVLAVAATAAVLAVRSRHEIARYRAMRKM